MVELDIGRLQKTKPYLLADALEILCGFGAASPVSKTDAYTLVQTSVIPAEEALNSDDPDFDDDNYSDELDLDGAAINEKVQGYIDECFRQLEYRIAEFGEAYPFDVNAESIALKHEISESQKTYLALLAASRIRTFESIPGFKQMAADLFELICRDSLRELMHPSAEVASFGPNSDDRLNKFGTNLLDAIPKLAKFLGMETANGWDTNLAAQGDAGIDLVGVQRLDENQGGWNVYIGQCAAHEEATSWSKKRAEADFSFYHYLFTYSVKPHAVLFIPSCYRQPNGKWADRRHADNVILMDRVRILKSFKESSPAGALVAQFLDQNLQLT